MTQKTLNKEVKNKIVLVLKRNNIKKAGIFGSYARGEAKKTAILIS